MVGSQLGFLGGGVEVSTSQPNPVPTPHLSDPLNRKGQDFFFKTITLMAMPRRGQASMSNPVSNSQITAGPHAEVRAVVWDPRWCAPIEVLPP